MDVLVELTNFSMISYDSFMWVYVNTHSYVHDTPVTGSFRTIITLNFSHIQYPSQGLFQTNNYIPLRLPISLTNLGNTCYLNSVLQILFQVNTVVPFDIWINHLLLVDKIQCTNSLPLLAFYKFLYLCKLSTISEGELADFA